MEADEQLLALCAGPGATRCAVMAPCRDPGDWGLAWNTPIDGGLLAPKEIRIEIGLQVVLQP